MFVQTSFNKSSKEIDKTAKFKFLCFIKQIDLGSIKDKYEEMFEMELWQAIDDECSSDFKRLLLNIIHDS